MDDIGWDSRFLELARLVSTWSKDPSTQVGAVIADKNRRIMSVGYNGFPRGVHDSIHRLEDRDKKYKFTVHAERNALLFANSRLDDCYLYTYPFMPCSECAGMIIQAGITRVATIINNNERWQESFKITKQMFEEASVTLVEYDKNIFFKS